MFSYLQKKMKLIFIIILLLIAPAFLLFGIVNLVLKSKEEKNVGELYGHRIAQAAFAYYRHEVDSFLFLKYPDQYDNIMKFYDVDRLVWNRILLTETAKKYGIPVSAEEVKQYISTFPIFRAGGGEFDIYQYGRILQDRLHITPAYFEKMAAGNYRGEKLLRIIGDSCVVFDSDMKEYFKETNEEVKIQYITFYESDFQKEVDISDTALKGFFDKYKQAFKVPDRMKMRYVFFAYDELKKSLAVEEKDIKAYYDDHKELYIKPPQEEKKKDGEAEKSVKDKKEEYKPFDEVKGSIKEVLLQARAEREADEKSHKLFREAVVSQSLEKAAKDKGVPVKETPFFKRGEMLQDLGVTAADEYSENFFTEVFQVKRGDLTLPLKTSKGFLVGEKTDMQHAHVPGHLDEVYDEVKDLYVKQEAARITSARAKEIQESLKKEKEELEMMTLLKAKKLELKETEYFKKIDSYVKGIGASKNFMKEAFSIDKGVFSSVVDIPGGMIIFRVLDRKQADFTKFGEQKAALSEQLARLKSERILRDWLLRIEKDAAIKIEASEKAQE
jgi:peptidyl-prolyl cis-trans isomerase D